MADEPILFQTFLKEEVDRVRGNCYPVRASFFRRVFVRHALTRRLHPNPDDEFSMSDIGPNYSIINHYESEYRHSSLLAPGGDGGGSVDEPIMVQKAKPDGYLILNGHHRWAAAFRIGVKVVKIKIVNLTRDKDFLDMLERGKSDKRVTLDLDETVFCDADEPFAEAPMRFPLNRIYRERVRQGIITLFRFLNQRNYDIWVYTSKYYSMEYIDYYFRHLSIRLAGIVTGTARKDAARNERLKKMTEAKYRSTVHIDRESAMRIVSGSRDVEERALSGSPETWAREVMDAIGEMEGKA